MTCEAVGYPDPSIRLQNSSGSVIDIATIVTLGTYETILETPIVSQDNCQGPYSCLARNANQGSIITETRTIDICTEGKFHALIACLIICKGGGAEGYRSPAI